MGLYGLGAKLSNDSRTRVAALSSLLAHVFSVYDEYSNKPASDRGAYPRDP